MFIKTAGVKRAIHGLKSISAHKMAEERIPAHINDFVMFLCAVTWLEESDPLIRIYCDNALSVGVSTDNKAPPCAVIKADKVLYEGQKELCYVRLIGHVRPPFIAFRIERMIGEIGTSVHFKFHPKGELADTKYPIVITSDDLVGKQPKVTATTFITHFDVTGEPRRFNGTLGMPSGIRIDMSRFASDLVTQPLNMSVTLNANYILV